MSDEKRKVIDYFVLSSAKSMELSQLVRTALKKGWTLYGTPFAIGTVVGQAIVLYEAPEPQENIAASERNIKV